MSLSIIIPAHDQAHSLQLTLTSLTRQTLEPDRFEVVLVDDCSSQDLAAVAEGFADRLNIRYLRNPQNLGRARTRNKGIAAAGNDDLLLLDADSYCTPDLLDRHHRFGDRGAGAVLLGRRREPDWSTLDALLGGRLPTGHSGLEEDPRYHLGFEPDTFAGSRTPWLFAYCNNMSVSRKLLDAVGGFNEDFIRWGYEDNELAYRIFRHHDRESGRFRYDADALTYHLPHFRNWRSDWSGAQGYVTYIKDRYRHFDVELLGAPPIRIAQALPHYERCLELLRATATGTAGHPATVLSAGGRELWFGFGVGRAGQQRCDHAAAPDDDNLHLLGVSTPFADGSFDRLINVDIWRMLNAADLSALLLEGFRVAGEVSLVWSTALGAPFATDVHYIADLLAPHCRLAVDADDGRGFAVLRCHPLVV